jgi:hypothetical protein
MVSFLPWLMEHIREHVMVSAFLHYCKKGAVRVFYNLKRKLLGALINPAEIERAVKITLVVSACLCAICAVGAIWLTAHGLKKNMPS